MNTLVIATATLTGLSSGFVLPRASTHGFAACSSDRMKTSRSLTANEDLMPGIQAINEANSQLLEQLDSLRQTSYFRLYSVDILASCEYMPQELFECYSETCEVYPVDEDQVGLSMTCLSCERAALYSTFSKLLFTLR